MQESATDTLCFEMVLDLIESYKIKAGRILEPRFLADQALMIEVSLLAFALADRVYSSLGVDRRLFRSLTMEWLQTFARVSVQNDLIYHRADFYDAVLRGRKVRGDWTLGNVDDLDDDPALRCLVAFGDILINPACADDYDSAPAPDQSAAELAAFARDIMTRVVSLFADFSSEVAESIVPHPDPNLDFAAELQCAEASERFNGMAGHLKRIAKRASAEERAFIDCVLRSPESAAELIRKKIGALEKGKGGRGAKAGTSG